MFTKMESRCALSTETKVNTGIEEIAYQLWPCRWMRHGFIEADGSKGEYFLYSTVEFGRALRWRKGPIQSLTNLSLHITATPRISLESMHHMKEMSS